jgi:hypothetical protein
LSKLEKSDILILSMSHLLAAVGGGILFVGMVVFAAIKRSSAHRDEENQAKLSFQRLEKLCATPRPAHPV